jgi:hypothetical protein
MKPISEMNLAECLDALHGGDVETELFEGAGEWGLSITKLRAYKDRIHDLTEAQAKRESELIEQFKHIAEASPQKWEMSRSEFELEFPLWARSRAKHIITPPEGK